MTCGFNSKSFSSAQSRERFFFSVWDVKYIHAERPLIHSQPKRGNMTHKPRHTPQEVQIFAVRSAWVALQASASKRAFIRDAGTDSQQVLSSGFYNPTQVCAAARVIRTPSNRWLTFSAIILIPMLQVRLSKAFIVSFFPLRTLHKDRCWPSLGHVKSDCLFIWINYNPNPNSRNIGLNAWSERAVANTLLPRKLEDT